MSTVAILTLFFMGGICGFWIGVLVCAASTPTNLPQEGQEKEKE